MFRKSVIFGRGTVSVSALAAAMVIAAPAMAQSDLGTIEGRVDGAAAGTQVTVTDANTGRKQVGTTDASGNYTIIGLRPSTYTVSTDGREAVSVTVLIGQTAVADFAAPGATTNPGSDIVVTGVTRREVRTPTVSTNITPAQIENIPQNTRNFLSFAALAPGVNVSMGGNAQVQAGALSSSMTNVLLDGMSLKNPINHGGIFGQNFGLGNPFPQSAVQEYKVETQNFGAETGQVGSALITAITKTGGNKFAGSAFIEFQPKSFITQPYFDKKNGAVKPEYNRKQFGGELSGPIIKDVLTFYIAGEGTIQNLPGSIGNVLGTGGGGLPAGIVSLVNVPRNFDFKQGLYFGKLTLFASSKDTINLEAFIRRENNLSDVDGNASLSHGRTILTHEDRYQFNWKRVDGNLLNVFNVAYDKSTQSTPPVTTGLEYVISSSRDPNSVTNCPGGNPPTPTSGYSCGADFSTLAQLGSHFFFQADQTKYWTVKDDLTLRAGNNTLKAGFQATFLDIARTVNDHFNGSLYFYNPGPTGSIDVTSAQPYGAKVNIAPTPTLAAKDTQIGLYVQDEWRPNEHWTFNLGVRWDYESNANNNNYVTPAAIATAIRNYPGWKAAGINPEDYISTGSNRKPELGAIQPRFGFSYDVNGDRDLVIFGGIGRYFDRSLFIEGVIETLTNSNNIANVTFCPNGGASQGNGKGGNLANCAQWNNTYRDVNNLRALAQGQGLTGGSVWLLNNKTPLPFSDQIDIGVRKRFGKIQVALTYAHIRSHNIFQFVRANYYENGWYTRYVTRDGNGNVTGCTNGGNNWIQDNSPNGLTNGNGTPVSTAICAAQNAQLAGFNGKLNIGSSGGDAEYNAVYLTIEKPFTDTSKWGFQTSLTISSARSGVAQELNSDEFYNGTAQNVYGWNNVNGVPKWNLVTTGSYRAPLGFILSGTLQLNSGSAFGSVNFDGAPDGACCRANFGGVYWPKPFIAYKRLDLRVAKTFKMPYDKGHELTFDFQVFNAFNWLNRTYSAWTAGSGSNPPLTENSQVGNDARSFQAGVKYKF